MSPAATDPDLPLLKSAQRGDFAAFESLVARHEQQLYRLARRILRESHDAEEVVQETFLSALEHLADFREEAAVRTWLLRIATNAALRILRKRRRGGGLPTVPLEPDSDDAPPHPQFIAPWQADPAILAQRHEIRDLLEDALHDLDEKYRVAFVLRDMEGLSIAESADALGISPANVKIRLMRARLMLRERLTQTLGDPQKAVPPHRHDH